MGNVIAFKANQQEYEQPLLLAAGAENFHFSLLAVPEVLPDYALEPFCINADLVLDLRSVRVQAHTEAKRILEQNRQNLRDGNYDMVPLDVDALGTAAKVAAIGDVHGKESAVYAEARVGLVMDCSRKWAEAFRKNGWEYFGETVQTHNAETDELIADGLSVDDMTRNGLSPVAEPEEAELRVNDYVSHMTHKAILRLPDADKLAAIRIRPCPQWAIDSYKTNPKGAHGGYAPEIEKLMVDYDWFDPHTKQVHYEQIGVSGKYITTEVKNETLSMIGAINKDRKLDKTEIHATIGIVPVTALESAVDLLRILDQVASEKSGLNIFMGEVVDANHEKRYESIYAEAEARRLQQQSLSEDLARYVENLHAKGIDPAMATVLVENYIQEIMLKVAAADPDQAEIIFNKETAQGFREVQSLHAQGRHQEAAALQAAVEQAAPLASSCGAGSCGLEMATATEATKARSLGLRGDIIHDTERACPGCGAMSVHYDEHGSKACTSCGDTELKG